jgi:lysophospholipase L1-like esterase
MLLVISSIVVACVILEVLLRLFFPVPGQPQFMPDPILGIRHTPHQRVWVANATRDFGTWFTTNSHGAPDVERSIEKPQRTYRIAVLGDSMVEGSQVSWEERFSSMLERQLTEWVQSHIGQQERVEVLNFGASSYGTTQEWLYYQSHVRHYAPDMVLVAVFANDIMNNSFELEIEHADRPEIRPFFYLDTAGKLVKKPGQYYQNAIKASLKSKGPHGSGFQRAYRTVRDHVRVVSAVHQAYINVRNADALSQSDDRQLQAYFDLYDLTLQQTSPQWQQAWKITGELLCRFAEDVARDGAQFHVAVIPSKWEVYGGPRPLSPMSEKATEDRYNWEFPLLQMVHILEKNDLSFTNLLPIFQEASKDTAPLFFRHDGHYAPAGHRALAAGLLSFLQEQIFQHVTMVSQ